MARTRSEDVTGIQTRGDKVRAVISVNQRLVCHPWVDRTSVTNAELQVWRHTQVTNHVVPVAGGIAERMTAYLPTVAHKPTAKQIDAHLTLWAAALGRDRDPRGITATELDAVMARWATDGLAPGTILKRRTTLLAFYKALNKGQSGAVNPVRESTRPRPPAPGPRGIDRLLLEAAIAAMPTHRSHKPGGVARLSLSKIRAQVMAATGIPQSLLMKVRRHDLVLSGPEPKVYLQCRNKGGGTAPRWVPLLPEGVAAFQAFQAADAFGYFATRSLNESFKRGCLAAGLDPTTICAYDIRHSFGTDLYDTTKDQATVARFMAHAPGSPITARYTLGAHESVDRAAAEALSAVWARRRAAVGGDTGSLPKARSLPRKFTTPRKLHKLKKLA